MTNIQYLAPTTLDEAVNLYAAAAGSARILAGGTDLLVQLRSGMINPGIIVNVKKIKELNSIEQRADGSFIVGASVSGAQLAKHSSFGKTWPGVLEALNLIGSTQVQGRASLGGNLCNGSPAGDSIPALIAAEATLNIQGPNGNRQLAVKDVLSGPGRTNLSQDEIAVNFSFPPRPVGSGDAYLRMIPRTEMDIAVVGCGVNLTLKNNICTSATVGLGAVAPVVLKVEAAAEALVGNKIEEESLERAAEACRAVCNPIDDKRGTIAYRTKVAGVLLKRAATIASQRAEGA